MSTPQAVVVAGVLVAVSVLVAVLILDEPSACESWQAEVEELARERGADPREVWEADVAFRMLAESDFSQFSERPPGCAVPD